MEAQVSGFTFFSTFDSGNLQKVEGIPYESHPLEGKIWFLSFDICW